MKVTFIFLSYILFSNVALAEKSDIDHFKSMMDRAVAEQKAGNHKVAIKLFKSVYSKSTDFRRDSLFGLVSSLKESKKWSEAVEYLKIEKRKSPFVGEYRIWLAEVYAATEQFGEALGEIDYAERILGQDKVVLRFKSFVQQKLGKHTEATDTLSLYLSKNPKDYIALADRADSYFQMKLYNQAHKDFQRAYELRPFEERVISSYVRSAYFTHNHREIKKVGQECVRLFPQNITCFEFMGKSSLRKKYVVNASNYFKEALALDPSRFDLRQLLAESLAFQGNFAESDAHFEIVLKQHPENELAVRSWTAILKQRKKIELLGATLISFSKNNPTSIWCAVELSKLLILVGDRDAAVEQMNTVAKESKAALAKFYYSYFLYMVGKYADAREAIAELKDPSLDIAFHLALLFFKEKKLTEAIQHWLRVPTESPHYFKAQVNSALAFEQQNNLEKAKEILGAITPPPDQKKNVEQKLISLSESEKRNPASDQSSGFTYFIEWSEPAL